MARKTTADTKRQPYTTGKESPEVKKLLAHIERLKKENKELKYATGEIMGELLEERSKQLNFCKPHEAAANCFKQLKEHVAFERAQFVSQLSIMVFKDQRDTVEAQRKELVYNENSLETLKANSKLVAEGHLS